MATGNDRCFHKRKVLLETVHLYVERCDAGRTHAGLACNRHEWKGSADRGGTGEQEIVSRGQRPVSPQGQNLITTGSGSLYWHVRRIDPAIPIHIPSRRGFIRRVASRSKFPPDSGGTIE